MSIDAYPFLSRRVALAPGMNENIDWRRLTLDSCGFQKVQGHFPPQAASWTDAERTGKVSGCLVWHIQPTLYDLAFCRELSLLCVIFHSCSAPDVKAILEHWWEFVPKTWLCTINQYIYSVLHEMLWEVSLYASLILQHWHSCFNLRRLHFHGHVLLFRVVSGHADDNAHVGPHEGFRPPD